MNHKTLINEQGAGQMTLIRVGSKAQITLPAKIREFLGVDEGDYLGVDIQNDGVVMRPQSLTDTMETVELSEEGERMLKEGLEEVKRGEIKSFNNVKDLINDLKK